MTTLTDLDKYHSEVKKVWEEAGLHLDKAKNKLAEAMSEGINAKAVWEDASKDLDNARKERKRLMPMSGVTGADWCEVVDSYHRAKMVWEAAGKVLDKADKAVIKAWRVFTDTRKVAENAKRDLMEVGR